MPSTRPRKPDYVFFISIILLTLFGIIMLASASSIFAFTKFGDSYFLVKHQLFRGIIPGIILLFLFAKIPYEYWKRFSLPLMIFSLILLILVFVPGIGAHYGRARSWLNIFGFSFQPGELTKLATTLYLSTWLTSREKNIKHFTKTFVPFIVMLGAILLLIVVQPDIGTMSIILILGLSIYFVAGASLSHLTLLIGIGIAGMYFLIIQTPYRLRRLLAFLNPQIDPLGISYHINQAFLAIGSGGWLGKGFGKSEQKFHYLPEAGSDSIFAVIAEEFGFLISLLIIAAFILLIYRGFTIAKSAPDTFSRLTATGIMTWISFQMSLNIGAMVGVMPITGVPLPFISYGSSAMIITLAACGIVINISKYTRPN